MKTILEKTKQLRAQLHGIPELSGQEYQTKKLLMETVSALPGLEIIDMGAWFYAVSHGDPQLPSIAFRADFDAVAAQDSCAAHLCGHDGHSAVLAGLARLISGSKPERTVYLIFQHAEETGEGGYPCSRLIAEKGISEVYAFHNTPGAPKNTAVLWKNTYACASTGLELKFIGSPAHAAHPEQGINPCLAMAQTVEYLDARIRQPSSGMILGTIVGMNTGAPAYGVSAYEGTVCMTLRAERKDEFEQLLSDMTVKAEELAGRYGLELRTREIERFPSTENDPRCTGKVAKAAEEEGIKWIEMPMANRASEDFGYYLLETSGAMFGVGDGEDHPGLHTAEFEYPDEISGVALKIFSRLISMN